MTCLQQKVGYVPKQMHSRYDKYQAQLPYFVYLFKVDIILQRQYARLDIKCYVLFLYLSGPGSKHHGVTETCNQA